MAVDVARACAIRPLTSIDELSICVELQRAAFNWADVDVVAAHTLVVMLEAGGTVLGAHHDERIVGFVNSLPGLQHSMLFWQSHMMCVLPAYQNLGVGLALKRAQREAAIAARARWIQWAFDPLATKNAYLSIAKLGAIVRRYSVNHYGTRGAAGATLDSDRLIAEWLVAGAVPSFAPERTLVTVPEHVHELAARDPQTARAIQVTVRKQLGDLLGRGLVLTGCERLDDACVYVLRRPLPGVGEDAEQRLRT